MTITTPHYTCAYGADGSATIQFPQRPPPEAIQALKFHRFRWDPAGRCWWKHPSTGTADLLDGLDSIFQKH
jgi:hypothetical protein